MTKITPICPLLGTRLAATDYASAVALTRSWADEPGVRAVAAANTHVVALGRHDPAFAGALAQFDLIVPDGMPLLWAMNRRGAGLRDRVYGPTLMLHALAQPGVSHFLFGGTEELLERLTARLRDRFPSGSGRRKKMRAFSKKSPLPEPNTFGWESVAQSRNSGLPATKPPCLTGCTLRLEQHSRFMLASSVRLQPGCKKEAWNGPTALPPNPGGFSSVTWSIIPFFCGTY